MEHQCLHCRLKWKQHRYFEGLGIASVRTTPILAPGCSTPLPVGKIVWFPGSPTEFYMLPSGANLSPFSSHTAKPRLWHGLGKRLCSLNQNLVGKGTVMREGAEVPNQKLLRKGRSGNDRSWLHNRWPRENETQVPGGIWSWPFSSASREGCSI